MNPVNSLGLKYKRSALIAAFESVLDSGQYSEGPHTKAFEEKMAKLLNVEHAEAFNSCGSALYTVFKYLVSRGAKNVAVQANTFYATGASAQLAGLDVILIDSSARCPSMSHNSLVQAWKNTGGFDAVCLTHVGGMVADDYEMITAFCRHNKVFLMEDCAHALGSSDGGVKAGAYADAAAWSLYPTKSVPVGEGGCLTTHDDWLAEYAHRFKSYGKHKVDGVICYEPEGMNLRMDEFNAAIACVQLDFLPEVIAARSRDASRLAKFVPQMYPDRGTNWYKYLAPVTPGWRTTGKVYCETDRLDKCLQDTIKPVGLTHAIEWSEKHMCLPLGEGMYDSVTDEQMLNFLRVP